MNKKIFSVILFLVMIFLSFFTQDKVSKELQIKKEKANDIFSKTDKRLDIIKIDHTYYVDITEYNLKENENFFIKNDKNNNNRLIELKPILVENKQYEKLDIIQHYFRYKNKETIVKLDKTKLGIIDKPNEQMKEDLKTLTIKSIETKQSNYVAEKILFYNLIFITIFGFYSVFVSFEKNKNF